MGIKRDFKANTREENADVYANYLPGGRLFGAKYDEDSNLRKLLFALAGEITRVQLKVQELADEYFIPTTTNLIAEWEKAVGIPDSCLKNTVTIEERRKQVQAKFALMKLNTKEDFIALAHFFGFTIDIIPGEENNSAFPFTFPVTLFANKKHARFTMIVIFIGVPQPTSVFPLTFPVTFGDNKEKFLMCLIRKLAPANVHIIYRYQ